MVQNFNIYGRAESPTLFLCNPDYTILSAIVVENRNINLRFSDTSEFSFEVYSKTTDDNGNTIELDYYDKISVKRVVLIEDVGYFQLVDVDEKDDGTLKYKSCLARSIQNDMGSKTFILQNGVYPLHTSVGNGGESLIERIMELVPDWTIGSIDVNLTDKYRSFEDTNKTLLEFLYTDIKEAFECVVLFDFLNRTISFEAVTSLQDNPKKTSIYMSFRNLLDEFTIAENADDIVTCLAVYGQDLDISEANPMGTQYIYNFDYYKNTDWMTQDLINAINQWELNYNSALPNYDSQLTLLHTYTGELDILLNSLADLKGQLVALVQVRDARIEQGLDCTNENAAVVAKELEISLKQDQIDSKQIQIFNITNTIKNISSGLSLENNFTNAQLKSLNKYIFEQDYNNDYYIVTTETSNTDRQQIINDLYEEGKNALERMSQPRYTFQINSHNFMFIKDFETFTSQLELGCIVTIELDEDNLAYPVLLEIKYNLDDPSDFALTFGNRYKLDDSLFTYTDLLQQTVSSVGRTNANWSSLTSFSKNYKDEVSELISGAFDLSKREIVSSTDQEQVWDSTGFLLRKKVSSGGYGGYDGRQIKFINNKIVFTDDNWDSVKTVIGEVTIGEGSSAVTRYGIVSEAIVGHLIAGNNLIISNESNTFRIDGTGFYYIENNVDTELSDYIGAEVNSNISSATYGMVKYFWLPANSNELYSEYTNVDDTEAYNAHVGHVWYNTDNGKTYTYTKEDGSIQGKYNYTWLLTDIEIPQELYDTIDGKKTVYTKRPASFNVNDIWVYEGAYSTTSNPTSDLMNSASPSSGFYQAPYSEYSGGNYKYFKQGDLLIATSDSESYNSSKWMKYSPNLQKGNDSFAFLLDNDGLTIENGDITLINSLNRIILDPSNGFTVSKNTGTVLNPVWSDKFYLDSNTGDIVMEGKITALAGGSIAGWTIDTDRLYSGSGFTYVELNSSPSSVFTMWAGNSVAASAPFRVARDGTLTANNINVTGGNIQGGTLGGWTITEHGIYKEVMVPGVGVTGVGILSTDPVSIYAGTGVDNRNAAPFRVTQLGEVHAKSIEGTDISFVGGSLGTTYGRLFYGDGQYGNALYFTSQGTSMKLQSGSDMSIDAVGLSNKTIYIGTQLIGQSGQAITIGNAGGLGMTPSNINLNGTVKVNGADIGIAKFA